MAEFAIVAGDWGERKGEVKGSTLIIHTGAFKSEKYAFKVDVDRVELQSEEDIRKLTWTRVFFLGIFALGAKKNKSKQHFAVYLQDGRKFLGVCDTKTWQEIQKAAF